MVKKGDIIGDYLVSGYIDDGGMADIWCVVKDGVEYALKICRSDDEQEIKRFEREYRLMKNIDHPNVVKAYDYGEIEGKPYIIMEKCDTSLEKLIESGITTKEMFKFSIQICEGLSFVHNNNETHRDIKPSNILLKDNVAKVSDFGIGRFMKRDTTTLTTTKEVWRSYGYNAPELNEEGKFREGSTALDIYALGCLLYYIFSDGARPEFANSRFVSADIYPIIAKCREYNPEDRYASVDDVLNALNAVLASRSRYKSLTELEKDKKNLSDREISENAMPLFYKCMGKGEIIANFAVLKNMLPAILKVEKKEAEHIAEFILNGFEKDNNYFLQFEDTEIMADMAVLLIPNINDSALCSNLFDLCFSAAIRADRWAAIRNIYDNIILKWNENTIKPYVTFIHDKEDLFWMMHNSIQVEIPQLVRNYFD